MGREIKRDNISLAVKRSMDGVELMLESVDVDELPDVKREALRKIIADYDAQTESLSTFSGEFKELAGKRRQVIVLCEKIAQELNQFTSINAVIATELAKLLDKTEMQVIQTDNNEADILEKQTIKNESSLGVAQKEVVADQYAIMETKEKAKKEYDNKKNMRFEDPVQKYSKERNSDLTLELEEIEKKIKETKSSLHKIDNDAVNIAIREEELRKYEKNKAELLARSNENFFANVTGGPDTSPEKFAYQPVDRSQNMNNVDDAQHANTEPKTGADAAPAVEDTNVQNVTQAVAHENATTQAQGLDTVAMEAILKRDIPHSGESVLTGGEVQTQKNEQAKDVQNMDLVHDPEAAAMGGFDDNEARPAVTSQVRSGEVVNRGTMDEEEKFDREVARRASMNESVSVEKSSINKENRDTDMNESEKFDREVEYRANVKSQTEAESDRKRKLEEKNARLAEAKNVLDNIRETLVVKRRRGETAMNKIRSLLGLQIGATQFSEEIKQLEEEYLKAQKSYSDILSEGTQDMNESEQKKINEEMRFMSCVEARQMYDAESKARLETTMGTVGDKIHKVGLWYKNLPKSVKYSMAAAMLAAGVVTGGAGITGAAVGTVAVVRRFFGAAAVGAGVGMALETRTEAKKQAAHQSEREMFMSLTIEQQKEILARMDGDTIQQYNKMQTSRRRIKLASISAAAAVLVGGKAASAAWHAFDGEAVVQKASNVVQNSKILESASFDPNAYSDPSSLKDAPMPTPDQAAFAFAGDAPESNGSVGQSIDPNSTWEKLVDGADPDQTPAGNVYESLEGQKEQVSHAQSFSQNENLHPANSDHATSVSQNENIRGVAVPDLSKMDGIAVDEKTGVGVLTVEKNSNYTKTLAAFLEKNQDRLTGGKMGWDPEKYKNAHEWAMKRATVLANEYRAAHKGVDLNMMQPGTEITLNLNNLSNIKTDVNFEGGPRIVPEGVKVEMAHTTPSGEIAKQIGMSEQVYQVSRDMSMRDYIGDLNNHPHKTPFEEKFLQYTESHPEVMSGKATLGEVLEKHYKEINSANMERPSASVGHDGVNVETVTPEQQLEQEIADYKEKIRDLKFFGEQMKGQTQQVFGMNIENISKAKVNFLSEHNPDVAQKLEIIKKEFGISFNEDTRVGPFMARVVAKSNGKSFEELGIIQS